MRKIFNRSGALIVIALFLQGCMDEELSPRSSQSEATSAASRTSGIRLHNSFSVLVRPYTMEYPIGEMGLEGEEVGKVITVDWGDGTVENYTFTEGYGDRARIYMQHAYGTMEEFVIRITGDLNNILVVDDPFNSLEILALDLSRLGRLEEFYAWYNSFEILDLSRNHRLKRVVAPSSTITKDVILPKNHEINYMYSGSPNLPQEVVSEMIASIYKNAVTKKIYGGYFALASIMEEYPTLPGPPTEEDMAKLVELRDVYGWEIFPNP